MTWPNTVLAPESATSAFGMSVRTAWFALVVGLDVSDVVWLTGPNDAVGDWFGGWATDMVMPFMSGSETDQ
jgi:hypothetical protein